MASFLTLLLAMGAMVLASQPARAQDIEPRAYSNAPVGVNFAIAGYGATRGGLAFDPTSDLKDPDLKMESLIFAYARTLDLWGKSAKFDAILPYAALDGTATYRGAPVERHVDGLLDPRFRLSVNFFGAPALGLKEFRHYRQDLILGASLQVGVPLGQYDPTRLVNLGNNRWLFKPELGASQAIGAWTLEGKVAANLYTDNKDFFGGQRRSQDNIYSLQGNVIYSFANGAWVSADVTWFEGGRTTLNGVRGNDLQQNWRVGATLAMPIDAQNSVKLHVSSGVSARTGNNYDGVGIAWQHRWGAGL
jgi:hypothetical protein